MPRRGRPCRPPISASIGIRHRRCTARPGIRSSPARAGTGADRASCSTATTTSSRSIRSTCGRTSPFEPRIAALDGGRRIIVARGACDDKGQVMTFVEACRAWRAVTGALPVDVTIADRRRGGMRLEEPGRFVQAHARRAEGRHRARMRHQHVGRRDAGDHHLAARPGATKRSKIKAANRDLHSGMFGGAAQNPIRVLTRILAALHDDNGRITIPGFYDGVRELPPDVRRAMGRPRPDDGRLPRRDRAQGAGRREGSRC